MCTQKDRVLDLECFLLGDLNSDFSKTQSPLYQALKHFLYICNWVQVIKEPTRITPTCSSILDVIIVSDEEKISQSGVIPIGISDHFLTYCTRHSPKTKFNKHNTIRSRSMKNYSTEIFNEKLSEINWFKVINCDDVDVAWSNFKDLFMSVVDKIAPLKEKRLKQRSEPWITSELLEYIRARDQALETFRKNKTDENYKYFCNLRNRVQYNIKKVKRDYFYNKISDCKNSSTDIWKAVKSLGFTKLKSSAKCIGLLSEDKLTFDKKTVANIFNTFFTTVAASLVGLNVSKATGLDGLSARFLKDGANQISSAIAHIINLSLYSGRIPDDMKTARVVPLYKKNSKSEPGNYRPVSILTVMSKILEKTVHKQLENYLRSEKLLYDYQSGFRNSYSTDSCLTQLTDQIRFDMDKGNYTGMVMIDLQKAFDTVDHEILLNKLKAIGLDDLSTSWFSSYLKNRFQKTEVDGIFSDPMVVPCGVPQGSILGPLLFLIYVNDMEAAVSCR